MSTDPTKSIRRSQLEFIPRVDKTIKPPKVTSSYLDTYNIIKPGTATLSKSPKSPKTDSSKDTFGVNEGLNIFGSIADAIPRKQSDDATISGLNQAYDAASSAIAAVPVVGTAISAGMKGIKAIEGLAGSDFGIKHSGKGGFWGQYNKMSDSTWALLSPTGWINRFTKTKVEESDTDLAKNIRGYSVADATPQEEIGGVAQDMAKFWAGKDLIGEAKKRRDRANKENMLKSQASYLDTQNQVLAQNSMQDVFSKNRQNLTGGLHTYSISAKKGAKINPASLRSITKKVKSKFSKEEKKEVEQFQQGGVLNVIPEGALHARKHNLPDDIKEQVTHKGIPVVTYDDGGEITQHAEIEANEIIFSKDTTKTLEDYLKEYNKAESDSDKARIAIECGKFLASEILENTDDRTGLLNIVE